MPVSILSSFFSLKWVRIFFYETFYSFMRLSHWFLSMRESTVRINKLTSSFNVLMCARVHQSFRFFFVLSIPSHFSSTCLGAKPSFFRAASIDRTQLRDSNSLEGITEVGSTWYDMIWFITWEHSGIQRKCMSRGCEYTPKWTVS